MFKEKMPFKTGTRVVANKPGPVEQAMRQRDVDLELAVVALRDATDDAFEAVQSLMHMVRRRPSLKPRRRKDAEPRASSGTGTVRASHINQLNPISHTGHPNGTLTVAEQLHQIAYQLRVLELSVLRSPAR
jgi:hypothetical protein